jgi:hypothetical protein
LLFSSDEKRFLVVLWVWYRRFDFMVRFQRGFGVPVVKSARFWIGIGGLFFIGVY